MFYLVGIFRTSAPGDSIQITLRKLLCGGEGMSRSFTPKVGGLNIKRLLLIKENEITQVK